MSTLKSMLGHFVHSSVFVACLLTIINILCNLKLVEISFDAHVKSTKVGKISEGYNRSAISMV